jgi:hypothetical protein
LIQNQNHLTLTSCVKPWHGVLNNRDRKGGVIELQNALQS